MKSESRIFPWPMLTLVLPLLLSGCAATRASAPPAAQTGSQPVVEVVPAIVQPAPAAPSLTDALLHYQQSLLQMKRDELQREAAATPDQPASPRSLLRRAMALATLRGPGDLARAQQLAEQALRSSDIEAGFVRPLAQLLANSYADLRRQTDQAERLAQQTREQQRRIDQLDHMLEGLKAIERNLATRPGAAASTGQAK